MKQTARQNPTAEASLPNSLTVYGAGKTIRLTVNQQTSVPYKSVSLAPLVQISDPKDPDNPNHDRFSALDTLPQNLTNSKKSKWAVPPKSQRELLENKKAREERKRIGQQKKTNSIATILPSATDSTLIPHNKIQWIVPPKSIPDKHKARKA